MVATADDLRRIALGLPGTEQTLHFDRTGFRVRRIYATLAPDGLSANLMLTPGEQALKCAAAPVIFAPVANAWGRKGATRLLLEAADVSDLEAALVMAHAHAVGKSRRR